MTETADDLSAPLGQDKPRRKRRLRLPFTAMQLLAVLLGLFLLTFAGFAIFNKDPLGGEPMTRIAIRAPDATDEKPPASSHGNSSLTRPRPSGSRTSLTMAGTRPRPATGAAAAPPPGPSETVNAVV